MARVGVRGPFELGNDIVDSQLAAVVKADAGSQGKPPLQAIVRNLPRFSKCGNDLAITVYLHQALVDVVVHDPGYLLRGGDGRIPAGRFSRYGYDCLATVVWLRSLRKGAEAQQGECREQQDFSSHLDLLDPFG